MATQDTHIVGGGQRRPTTAVINKLLLLCVWTGAFLNLEAFRTDVLQSPPDRAANVDQRFEQLRPYLNGAPRVGYITDPPSGTAMAEQYFLAQYALAPVVVEIGISPQLVVGNFTSSDSYKIPDSLTLVRDFGNGVLLLRRR